MIDAIVLFASHDKRFFELSVNNLLSSGIRVHLVTYTHLWMGQPENITLLDDMISHFSNHPHFYSYRVNWHAGKTPWYWEAAGRSLPLDNLPNDSEYCLFIDIDEIVDVEKFTHWLSTNEYRKYDSMTVSNYWYFREATIRSTKLEDNTVMCKTELAKLQSKYTGARFKYLIGHSVRMVGSNDTFIHHYSWVRNKEEMISKTTNWGHNNDKHWASLIETELSKPFSGVDFVHGYTSYEFVENKFDLH